MLWRRKLRSSSPPRLTSSIPEMERHLAALDSPVPEHPANRVHASSITLKDLQAPSNHDEGHVKMQAASSANKAVPDMAEPNTIPEKDDRKASTTPSNTVPPKPKKTDSIRIKAQRSRPRLLTLLACVSYLLFQLLGADLGLRFVNSYTAPRLDQARVQLQAAMSDLASERIVHHKLDILLETTLERQYIESYEHCLARALYKADKVFLGLDFTQFPNVRNQTMDWATDNCDRLLYTPQLHNPNVSKLWATANNVRRAAEKAFELFKYKAVLLRCKLRGTEPRLAAKPTAMQAEHDTKKRSEVPAEMPFGFSLDCEGPARCRLAYSGPSPVSATDKKTAASAVVKASKEVIKWSYSFDRAFRITGCMIDLLSLLHILLVTFLLLAGGLSQPRFQPQSQPASKISRLARAWSRFCNIATGLQLDEKLAIGLMINTALYALLHYQFDFITSEFDRLLLPAGLGFCAFHIPQALAFLNPEPDANETLRSFCRATHELYLIMRGAEFPEPTSKKHHSSARSKAISSPNAKPASKIAARFISPLTTISEDLVQERKAMHAEQGKQPRDDVEPRYGYATETDNEYDSDVQHAGYVDLTGGATPTVSEEGEDWSVVEG